MVRPLRSLHHRPHRRQCGIKDQSQTATRFTFHPNEMDEAFDHTFPHLMMQGFMLQKARCVFGPGFSTISGRRDGGMLFYSHFTHEHLSINSYYLTKWREHAALEDSYALTFRARPEPPESCVKM